MGLEGVELLLELESDFSVSFLDEDLGLITTVGDLYDAVLRKLGLTHQPICLTSRAFYRLRRGLVTVVGCERKTVKRETQLATLLPRWGRRRVWARLRQASELPLPDLERPRYLSYAILAFGLLIAGRIMIALVCPGDPVNFTMVLTAAAMAAMVGFLAVCFGWVWTKSAARLLPTNVNSVEDLVRLLVPRDSSRITMPAMPRYVDEETVWLRLVAHTARIAHVPVDSVRRGTRLGQDLGF